MRELILRWARFKDHLTFDLFGGPRPFKAATVINLQKGGTLPFVLLLMALYDCWGTTAWVYAALHGSYGLLWLLKDRIIPDASWERRVTIAGAVVMWAAALGLYWLFPWLLVSRAVEAPGWLIATAVLLYAVGVVLMMGADGQKTVTLALRRGLITSGFFARVRHPNYLGEMMLYAAFALLVRHWLPWAVLAWVWLGVFVPNMVAKEASMSRYPEWPAYVRRTGMLLPRLRPRHDLLESPPAG